MLGRKSDETTASTGEVNAFLGKGTSFEGKIRFEGMFRIDGAFQGEVLSGDSLVIGDTGDVKGQINVNSLMVNGKVTGSVTARNRIEITPTGQIRGDIQTPTLIVSEGATFEGKCQMGQREMSRNEQVSLLGVKENEMGETEVKKTNLFGSSTGVDNNQPE